MSLRVTALLILAILASGAAVEPDEPGSGPGSTASRFANEQASAVTQEFDLARRWREHWAWQPVQATRPPTVRNDSWATDPIDRFVLARLDSVGLLPAPPADKRALLRRIYFDLIGLPPTPDEVEAFVADGAADAFARVVERLLASPHFGERWGRHWLDLVRYAETRGHEFDHVIPNAFQYRDYVIRALNADLAYDQFVSEHVAGDLMENPRVHATEGFNESVLGTGFWCLGEEMHSPVDIRADEADRIDNKIDVFSKTFLGLTVACARCHDHKFDAISMRDYYSLAGFLLSSSYRQVPFESMEHNRRVARELQLLEERIRPVVSQAIAQAHRPAVGQTAQFLLAARKFIQSHELRAPQNCDTNDGADEIAAQYGIDTPQLQPWTHALRAARHDHDDPLHLWSRITYSAGRNDDQLRAILQAYVDECATRAAQIAASWRDLRILVDFSQLGADDWFQDGIAFGVRPVRAGDVQYSGDPGRPIAEVIRLAAAQSESSWDVLQLAQDAEREASKLSWAQAGRTLRTRTFTLSKGKLFYLVRGGGYAYAAVDSHRMIAGPLHGALMKSWHANPAGKWHWVEHDLSHYRGHRVHIEFSPEEPDSNKSARSAGLAIALVVEADGPPCEPESPGAAFGRKLAESADASFAGIAQAYADAFTEAIDRFAADKIIGSTGADPAAWLANWIIQHPQLFLEPESERSTQIAQIARPLFEQLAATKARFRCVSQVAPGLLDGSGVNEYVLHRGNHRTPGELAPRRFLEALGAQRPESHAGSGRLELARWMTDPTSPLLVRVLVNRVWHHLFGRGIVASVDNFGALGSPPTHPELLDYLAGRFVEQGWSLKRLLGEIVLSNTYQMSARPMPEAQSVDPQNLLWHHKPIRRLEGEAIRDAMLAISGRLDAAMFGRSVELRLTPFMEGRGRPATSGPLDGNGRRSLYLRVRRNFLHPMLMAFDAPTPCTTIGRRSVSNVPAQALSLMNNDFVVAQARAWARNMINECPMEEQRVHRMFLAAFGRPCTAEELSDSLQFIIDQQERYDGAGSADARAWEDLAHVLFNTKEFIFIQ